MRNHRRPRSAWHIALFVGFAASWIGAFVAACNGAPKDTVDSLVGLPVFFLLVYLAIRLLVWLLRTWLGDVRATVLTAEGKHETKGEIAMDVAETTAKDAAKLVIATAIESLDIAAAAAGGGGGGGGSSGGGGSFGGGGASGSW